MARRRQFSNSEKRRIVTEADGCAQPWRGGRLLWREGIYSSHLSTWRRQRKAAELGAFQPNKRDPKVTPGLAEAHRLADLTRENARLRTRLSQAHLIIEVQKKYRYCWGYRWRTRSPDGRRHGTHARGRAGGRLFGDAG